MSVELLVLGGGIWQTGLSLPMHIASIRSPCEGCGSITAGGRRATLRLSCHIKPVCHIHERGAAFHCRKCYAGRGDFSGWRVGANSRVRLSIWGVSGISLVLPAPRSEIFRAETRTRDSRVPTVLL